MIPPQFQARPSAEETLSAARSALSPIDPAQAIPGGGVRGRGRRPGVRDAVARSLLAWDRVVSTGPGSRPNTRGLVARGLLLGLVLAATTACGARSAPAPEAGFQRGGIPDLRGERVLLLPPQMVRGGHAGVEQELLFALEGRSAAVTWIGPEAIRRRAASTPTLALDPDGLPVERFLYAQVERVGDPLFGALYRLGAMEDANWALIPIEIRDRMPEADTLAGGSPSTASRTAPQADPTGLPGGPPASGEGASVAPDAGVAVEIVAALIHPRSGRVVWFGVVDGTPGPLGALPATASAAEALARRLLSF
jgi:hypothetical protein